jgi:hypothetical protein
MVQNAVTSILDGVYAGPYSMKLVKTDKTNEYQGTYPEVRVSDRAGSALVQPAC